MSFLTGDDTQLSAGDWARVQTCWFPKVESDTITQISEVTAASIATYLEGTVNQVVKDAEFVTPSYTPISY